MMFFSPVCFFPWRAAWPEVVKVSVQEKRTACGHGYFFFPILDPFVFGAEAVWRLEGVAATGVCKLD